MTGELDDFAEEFDLKYGKIEQSAGQFRGFTKNNTRCENRGHYEVDGEFYCAKHIPRRDAA